MKPFLSLLWLQFQSAVLSQANFGGGKKKKRILKSGIAAALLLFAGLSIYMGLVYAYSIMRSLREMAPGHLLLLFPFMGLFTMMVCLLFTGFRSQDLIFGGKDIDFLLSLPFPSQQLILSKMLALYFENLLLTFFMLVPSAYVYSRYAPLTPTLLFGLVIGILLLPLFPTFFSTLMGMFLNFVGRKVPHKNIVVGVLSMAGLLFIIFGSMQLQQFIVNALMNPVLFENTLRVWVLPLYLFYKGLQGQLTSLLLMVPVTLLSFLAATWLVSLGYKNAVNGQQAAMKHKAFSRGEMMEQSPFAALLKKEAARFFGTPMYLANTGLSALLMPIGGVAAVLYKAKLAQMLAPVPPHILKLLPLGILFFLLFNVATLCTTSSSISLEGDALWILKESPVRPTTVFASKAALNLIVSLPALVLSSLLLAFAFNLPPAHWPLVTLPAVATSVFTALFGLVANLLYPRLDAANPNQVIKQSLSVLIGTFVPMLVGLGSVALGAMLVQSGKLIFPVMSLLLTLFWTGAAFACYQWLRNAGVKKFEAL